MGKFLDEPINSYKGKFLDEERSVGEFVTKKLPQSAGKFIGGIAQAVSHPIQTVKGVGEMAVGVAQKTSPVINVLKAAGVIKGPLPQEDAANALVDHLKQRYGGIDNILTTAYEDPVGMAADVAMVVEPATGMLKSGVVGATRGAARGIAGGLEKSAVSKVGKAQDLTAKILNPKNLGEAINRGELPSSVTEASKVIKKVKDYRQLRDIFEQAKKKPMQARENIYALTRGKRDVSQLDEAMGYLKEQAKNKRVDPRDIGKIEKIIKRELEALSSETPDNLMDPNYLQKQKEFYQTKTKPLYKKRDAGTLTGNEPAQLEAYDALARGYKKKLESLDPRLKSLNREFQGLDEAQRLASEQAANMLTAENPSNLEKVINSSAYVNRFAAINQLKNIMSEVGKSGRKLPARTSKIERLMKTAERDRAIARMLKGEKPPKPYEMPPQSPEDFAGAVRPRGPRPGSGLVGGPKPMAQISGPVEPRQLPAPENLYGETFRTMTPDELAAPRLKELIEALPEGPQPSFPKIEVRGGYAPPRPTVETGPVRGTFPLESEGIRIEGPTQTPYQRGLKTSVINRLMERRRIFPPKRLEE